MKYFARLNPRAGEFILQSTQRSQAATLLLEPMEASGDPNNEHDDSDHWVFVLAGEGRAVIGSEAVELGPGALLLIEAGETHEINNTGDRPLETVNFYAPPRY